jgi:hypothetical protein
MFNPLNFLTRARRPLADELDTALAGVQVGLQRRRAQWLLWLIEEKREPLRQRLNVNRPTEAPTATVAQSAEEAQHGT